MENNLIASPETALVRLMEGNRRFVRDELSHPRTSLLRLKEVSEKQSPFAAIITCSDSRVPPEVIFDCGIGDIFVVRESGNILSDTGLGGLAIAVDHLKCPLVMVLGHESCNAFKFALQSEDKIEKLPAMLRELIARLRVNIPETLKTHQNSSEMLNDSILENVRTTAGFLELAYRGLIDEGKLAVKKAYFSFRTGRVTILEND